MRSTQMDWAAAGEAQDVRGHGRRRGSEEHEGNMTLRLLLLGAGALQLGAGCSSVKQAGQVYKHPSLNIEFTAGSGWERVPRPQEPGVYEAVDPRSAIHVLHDKGHRT
jgi:hypothetical protein